VSLGCSVSRGRARSGRGAQRPRHRIHSLSFKKQIVQEYAAGATLNGLAREHDLSRNLIRVWISKSESGDEAATLLGLRGQDRRARADGRPPGERLWMR
jgi:transposase